MQARFSAGLWLFGGCADRFAPGGYSEFLPVEEQIRLAGQVEGLEGVELHWSTDFNGLDFAKTTEIVPENVEKIKRALQEASLAPSCLNVNTFSFPEWKHGAFTHRSAELRQRAVETAKTAVEVAKSIGCSTVGLWLAADGFDYPFQVDYRRHWNYLVEGIKEVAGVDPRARVAIEYKPKEPRTHMQIGTVGKALYVVQAIGLDNVGVTMDIGHALMAYESPADSLCLLTQAEKLFNVHFNDAYRYWDDDMMPGVIHFWETLEFLYYCKQTGYSGWIGLDMFPYRENPVEAARMAIENLRSIMGLVEKVNVRELEKAQETMDAVATQRAVRGLIY